MELQDPLTGRSASVKDAADRLSAALMLARGDHAAALPLLTAMVDTHPSAHWANGDLGWCQFHLGRLQVRDGKCRHSTCWGAAATGTAAHITSPSGLACSHFGQSDFEHICALSGPERALLIARPVRQELRCVHVQASYLCLGPLQAPRDHSAACDDPAGSKGVVANGHQAGVSRTHRSHGRGAGAAQVPPGARAVGAGRPTPH